MPAGLAPSLVLTCAALPLVFWWDHFYVDEYALFYAVLLIGAFVELNRETKTSPPIDPKIEKPRAGFPIGGAACLVFMMSFAVLGWWVPFLFAIPAANGRTLTLANRHNRRSVNLGDHRLYLLTASDIVLDVQ